MHIDEEDIYGMSALETVNHYFSTDESLGIGQSDALSSRYPDHSPQSIAIKRLDRRHNYPKEAYLDMVVSESAERIIEGVEEELVDDSPRKVKVMEKLLEAKKGIEPEEEESYEEARTLLNHYLGDLRDDYRNSHEGEQVKELFGKETTKEESIIKSYLASDILKNISREHSENGLIHLRNSARYLTVFLLERYNMNMEKIKERRKDEPVEIYDEMGDRIVELGEFL